MALDDVQLEQQPSQDVLPADDVDEADDIDHVTCCDPAYYLATGRPVYAVCGHRVRPDDVIKLEPDGTPLCTVCVETALSCIDVTEEDPSVDLFCAQHCPRHLFG